MKKRTLIIILGVWIALVPILGLPNSWKNNITIVSGLAVVLFAATRKKSLKSVEKDQTIEATNEAIDEVVETETIEVVGVIEKPTAAIVADMADVVAASVMTEVPVVPVESPVSTSRSAPATSGRDYIIESAMNAMNAAANASSAPASSSISKPKRAHKPRAARLTKAKKSDSLISNVIIEESVSVQ